MLYFLKSMLSVYFLERLIIQAYTLMLRPGYMLNKCWMNECSALITLYWAHVFPYLSPPVDHKLQYLKAQNLSFESHVISLQHRYIEGAQ